MASRTTNTQSPEKPKAPNEPDILGPYGDRYDGTREWFLGIMPAEVASTGNDGSAIVTKYTPLSSCIVGGLAFERRQNLPAPVEAHGSNWLQPGPDTPGGIWSLTFEQVGRCILRVPDVFTRIRFKKGVPASAGKGILGAPATSARHGQDHPIAKWLVLMPLDEAPRMMGMDYRGAKSIADTHPEILKESTRRHGWKPSK